ncbi:hypothetical protein A2U01_0094050, partial [Trifolium medium]|nr:hypothetical protein [Trifolium medium]
IDSSLEILVLGQKFTIRVLEDNGWWQSGGFPCCGGCGAEQEDATSLASNVGGASVLATVVGDSVGGSEGDPLETCQ